MFNNYWKNIWKTLTHISVKGRSSKQEFLRFFILRLILLCSVLLFLQLPASYVQHHLLPNNGTVLPIAQSLTVLLYFLCVGGIHLVINLWASIAEFTLTVRRFHDFNKSGWLMILFWVVGIIVIVFIAILVLVTVGISCNIPKDSIKALSSIVSNILVYGLYFILCSICIFKKGTIGPNKYGEIIMETDN